MKLRVTLAGIVIIVAACTPAEVNTTVTSSTLPPSSTTTTTAPAFLTGVGVGDGTIHLAAFLPLSGSLAGIGESILEGHRAYWQYVNSDLGGVAGRFIIALDEVDTAYDPVLAAAELATREDSILGISAMLGSPVTRALLEADSTMPIMVGSQAVPWAKHHNAVYDLAMPTYRDQVSVLWNLAVDAAGDPADVGFVAVAGLYGDDCLAGTVTQPQIISRYPAGTTDFEDVVRDLDGAKALVSCVTSADLVRIIATENLLGIAPPIYATGLSYDPTVLDALEEVPEDLWVAGALPAYEDDTPGMKLFRTVTDGLDDVNAWTFLGYTQAATFHLLLEQAVDHGTLNRSGVLAARGHVGDVDFGYGWGPAGFDVDGILPVVPVVISVPDPDAAFGLRVLDQ
ncbi:MAG: ABC transporter substrate-binding protein [Gammaproteobacteria bacterium]|nr:ABC transporter substrate-binding protein [Gammaproteobacteria bacterium]